MTFRFARKDGSVAAALRRIAIEEVEDALAALRDEGQPLAGRVHACRKAVKKLRGLIRLVRPVFPRYGAENDALRSAGRRLSHLRESEVLRATLGDLAEGAHLTRSEAEAAAPPLGADSAAPSDAALSESISAFADELRAVAGRSGRWTLCEDGFDAIAPGLETTWTKARRAMKHALRSGEDDAVHEWRKRVKDHWYQARLLEPIWPEMMAPHVAAADQLGEMLGLHNDLSEVLRRLAGQPCGGHASDRLAAEARRRKAALLAEAEPLGRRLLAGPAEALGARWCAWWELWRG